MPSGSITLGQVAARFRSLNVACNRCARLGRYRIDRLLEKHGPDMPIPELRRIVAADCPRMRAGALHDPCGVRFPGLAG